MLLSGESANFWSKIYLKGLAVSIFHNTWLTETILIGVCTIHTLARLRVFIKLNFRRYFLFTKKKKSKYFFKVVKLNRHFILISKQWEKQCLIRSSLWIKSATPERCPWSINLGFFLKSTGADFSTPTANPRRLIFYAIFMRKPNTINCH